MPRAIDIEKMKEQIKEYFEMHSQRDILEKFYKDTLETIDKFDKELWVSAINEQIALDNEELFYTDDPEKKKYEHLFDIFSHGVGHLIDEKIPWTEVKDTDFPTSFRIFENNGDQLAVTLMIGQGCAIDVCPISDFKKWMERIGGKYEMPEPLKLDDLEQMLKDGKKEILEKIANASTYVRCSLKHR